ncbi:MAG: amino acid adenylation domain-containing protein [Bacteroidota bacterium]
MEGLVSRLVKKGIRIGASEDSLRIQVGNASLTDSDKQELKNFKPQLIKLLKNNKVVCLSYPQERLWFLAQLGYSKQYHIPSAFKVKGNFDVDAFSKSLNNIVSRHESFRTSFRQIGDLPVQFIKDEIDFKVENIDLSQYSEADQAIESERLIRESLERPFELENAPLLRAIVIRISEKVHLCALCMHHIVSDGWSSGILLRELNRGYQAYANGTTPDFTPLKMQYSGYAVWQKETLTDQKLENEIKYWKDQLQGYEDLNIPTDFFRPAKHTGSGKNYGLALRPDVRDKLKVIVEQKRITSFTILFATAYLMLSRYGRQHDICFGMPVANRNHKDLEDIIGFFVNTLVIRISENEEEKLTVWQLLEKVNKAILNGQENQDIPVEKIMEILQPRRDLSRSPIFQVLINYGKIDGKSLKFGDCDFEGLPLGNQSSKFDLTFGFNELPSGDFSIGIEYCDDLFTEQTIINMLHNFVYTVDYIVDNLYTPVSEFELANDRDKTKVLEDWNATERPVEQLCIHELFEQKARSNPNQIAVKSDHEEITYEALNEKSDALAKYLQSQLDSTNQVVGIGMSRSANMIVAVLGILKAGAAYVPLDPGFPKDRLQHMRNDTGARIILTDEASEAALQDAFEGEANLIKMDTQWDEILTVGASQSISKSSDQNSLAYVIYTSGSTGTPKGVMVTHKNVVNHNMAAIDIYGISEKDRVMQFSTINFDIFVEEVFPTLMSGATLIMLDQQQYLNISYIKDILQRQEISVVNWPTAFWHSLSEEDFSDSNLRMVIIGGEKAEMTYFNNWQRHNSHITVMNTYGPTETTVISLYHKIEPLENRSIPVGKPIYNTSVYVMSKSLKVLGVGVPGELCIAGAGVSNGYLNNEALTEAKFVKASAIGGTLIYRTGDLVRWLPDGNIEFLGRIDEQVKIRGFRVEPGEVENVLVEHPDIESGVVIAREFKMGKQLVAFYKSSEQLPDNDLKKFLLKRLPEYMVPALFVRLDAIPMTPGGKVNKRQLLEYRIDLAERTAYVAPETPVQKKMVAIWESVTGAEKLGITHNFFEIGGNSIMATQLVSRINKEMNQEITITMLFENPDIESLSEVAKPYESQDDHAAGELEIETLEF